MHIVWRILYCNSLHVSSFRRAVFGMCVMYHYVQCVTSVLIGCRRCLQDDHFGVGEVLNETDHIRPRLVILNVCMLNPIPLLG